MNVTPVSNADQVDVVGFHFVIPFTVIAGEPAVSKNPPTNKLPAESNSNAITVSFTPPPKADQVETLHLAI